MRLTTGARRRPPWLTGSGRWPRRPHSPYTLTGRVPKAHMHVIGTGVIPACRDTNHSTDQDRSVPVARIDGVDPGVAVAQYLAHYPFGLVFVNKLSLTTINTG